MPLFPLGERHFERYCRRANLFLLISLADHSSAAYRKKPMPTLPFDSQHLPVGDGHALYVAQYGKPDGPAAVVLHGGPGSGTQPSVLDWFDRAMVTLCPPAGRLCRMTVIVLDR